MAKSIRSKREKRLRAIRRELVEPFYDKKESAKLVAQEAASAAPKLPVRTRPDVFAALTSAPMDITPSSIVAAPSDISITDVAMADGSQKKGFLKATGRIGKKSKRNSKAKGKRHGKNKFRKRHI